MSSLPFDLASLRHAYNSGATTPEDVIGKVFDRIEVDGREGVWISLREKQNARDAARALDWDTRDRLPLWGVPFSVKDNIDVAGLPTTAACPAFAYMPERSAKIVHRLEEAGAICIGKTNLDQFATGLSGTRSPYGACGSAFDPAMIAGGSSSGSAVSVALHHVSFSIGTDTGGSGRIPAGLNNVVGLKPTKGTLSLDGIVPCCETLDCPSVFALSIEDACEVAALMHASDPGDGSLRDDASETRFDPADSGLPAVVMVPDNAHRTFFGNAEGETLFDDLVGAIAKEHVVEPIDFSPFIQAGALVFDGPWIADRYAGIGRFVEAHPADVTETTRSIILRAIEFSGADVFEAIERLRQIKGRVRTAFGADRLLVVPTVACLYSIEDLLAEPIERNTHNGFYSYFVNPLDLCAMSVPGGFYSNGMPLGVTVIGPAHSDPIVARFAQEIARIRPITPGKARS